MNTVSRCLCFFSLAGMVFCLSPATSHADYLLAGSDGLNNLGFFQGSLGYTPHDDHSATLTIQLTNTSPLANGGYLTAFAFNNPGGETPHLTGVTLSSAPAHFVLIGDPSFNGGISGTPFGHFDLGAAISETKTNHGNTSDTGIGNFDNGGSPSNGLAVGQSGTFVFNVTGNGLNSLNELSFVNELSTGHGEGEGNKFFVARFRGFTNGDGDKVPADPLSAPEPGTMTLAGLGFLGLCGYGWRRRKMAAR